MFCGKCGTEIKEGSLFCHVCGAPTNPSGHKKKRLTEVTTHQNAPEKKKEIGKRPMPVIPMAAGALLVIVLVVILVASLFGGPSAKVMKALTKSGKEFYAIAEEMKLTDASELLSGKKLSQTIAVRVDDFYGMDGIGVRMNMDTTLPEKKIGIRVTPFIGSADLVSLQMKLDGSRFYFGSPELTEGSFYMISTETMGKDLSEMLAMDELEEVSFNLFDIAAQMEKAGAGNEAMLKDMKKAFVAFAKDIEIKKNKKETIEVNDTDLKCTSYHVTLTEDAMDELLDALEEAYKQGQNADAYMEIVKSMGLPEEIVYEVEDYLSNGDMDDTFDELHDAVDELGDVELDLYLNGGYVVAAVYENEDSDSTITLNIGGGKNYVDDISLRIEGDNFENAIVATGNHACAGGEFTSEIEVTEKYGTNKYTLAKIELSYEMKAEDDNFSLNMDVDGDELNVEGYVKFSGSEVVLNLDELYIDGLSVGVEYKAEKYAGDSISVKGSKNLAEMSEDDLIEEVDYLTENLSALLGDLFEEYPELMYLF